MNATIEGYSYHASSTTDFHAIAVVLFHCLVALAHTIHCVLHGVFLDYWDMVTEVLILALGSAMYGGLPQTTGAGVKNRQTFKWKAWVKVKKGKVVLVFDNEAEDEDRLGENLEILEETKTKAEAAVEPTSSVENDVKGEERPASGNPNTFKFEP